MIIEHGLSYCLRLPIERVTILLSLFQYTLGTFLQEKKQRRIMKKMRVLLQRRFIFAPPVNWKSSSINSQHVHFSLYSNSMPPGQARQIFFSMDPGKKVTHAKNRRRPLNWLCSSIRSWSCLQWFFSLAKFFLEEQKQGQEGKLPYKITLGFRKSRKEKQEKCCKCEE